MEGKFCFYHKLTAGGISNHEARFRQMPRRFENGKTRDPMGSPRLSVSIGSPHQPNRETARQRDEFDAGSSPFNDSYKVVSGNLDRLSFRHDDTSSCGPVCLLTVPRSPTCAYLPTFHLVGRLSTSMQHTVFLGGRLPCAAWLPSRPEVVQEERVSVVRGNFV